MPNWRFVLAIRCSLALVHVSSPQLVWRVTFRFPIKHVQRTNLDSEQPSFLSPPMHDRCWRIVPLDGGDAWERLSASQSPETDFVPKLVPCLQVVPCSIQGFEVCSVHDPLSLRLRSYPPCILATTSLYKIRDERHFICNHPGIMTS